MQSALFIFILGIIPSLISALCRPPNIDFRKEEKYFFRRLPYLIEIDVDKCKGLPLVYYRWTLIHAGSVVRDRTYRDFIVMGYEHVPVTTAFTRATTLTVSVSHYANFTVFSEKMLEIEFVPEPFHLELVGGKTRIISEGKSLILDAISFSVDPTFSDVEGTQIKGYDFEWNIQPPIKQKYLGSLITQIPPHELKLGETYNISLTVIRGANKAVKGLYDVKSVSQIVHIKRLTEIPILQINCLYNCNDLLNPVESVKLEINCLYNCDNVKKKWVWVMIPRAHPDFIQFGSGHDKLIIYPRAYSSNAIVEIFANDGINNEYKKIIFAPPVIVGNCFIVPKQGVSGVTIFKLTCEAFRSSFAIKRYTVYQKFDERKLGILIYYGARLDEEDIFLSPGSPAVLTVYTEDESFKLTPLNIEVEVKSAEVALNDIKVIVLGRTSYSLYRCWEKNLRHQMAQTISFVLDSMENIYSVPIKDRKKVYRNMVKYIAFLEPRDFTSVVQWLTVFEKMAKFYNTSLDTFTSLHIARTLETSLQVLQYIVFHDLEPTSLGLLQFFLNRFFVILSFLMKPIEDVKNYLSIRLTPNEYDTYDEMVHDRLEIRDNLRAVTESCFRSLEMIRNLLMHSSFIDEKEKTYSTKYSGYIAGKIFPKNMPPYITLRNISNSRVQLSDNLKNFLAKTYSSIGYYFVIFSYDPFWWHLNISELPTDKLLFGIYHEREKITVVPAPFYVTLAMKEDSISKIEGTITDASHFNINVHRIILTSKVTISIFFEETTENFHARFSDCYCGPEDMKNAKVIAADSFERDRVLHYDTKDDVTYLCIQRLGLTNLSYVGWIKHFECMYWDLELGNFRTEGTNVSELHVHPDDNLVCESFHFSVFLGRAIAPVHYLNTPMVMNFQITFHRNLYIIILVAVLLFIWLILLHWAVYKDREFAKRNVVCKLDDNVPGDQHIYLVVVFTGIFVDAGTTADVAFQLKGEESESRVHLIKCCNMSLLKRNSQDWFIIYTPEYLGTIKTIRLWHNCRGSEPHWYCQRIIVQHLKSGYQYCFIVDDWLSLIWGRGKIYHEIPVQHWMEMEHWKALFAIKMEKLKEDHLWVSVIGRQSQSNFNNKERVSTAIAAIFLSMLSCAFLLGYPHGVPSDSIDPQTKYFITPDTITIFTESWLISIPVIVFVIFIFKNSAP